MNERVLEYMRYHPVRTQRGLEIASGLVPWTVIAFIVVGSFFIPIVVAYFVITFNVYWLYRSLQTVVNATAGYLNMKASFQVDWLQKLKSDPETKNRFSHIHHVVIIPNVKESIEVIEKNLESIVSADFPKKNIVVVLAMEERVGPTAHEKADYLIKKYKNRLGQIFATFHQLIPGETMGKHSNESFAVKEAKKKLVDGDQIPIEDILITTSDADSVFPKGYFSLLTYKFLLSRKPFNNFFQAPLFAYNNLFRVPLLVRVPSIIGGIVFLATLQKASKRFMVWSTYSTSLKLLDSVGYWDKDYIPEDWHIYLKSYFALSGDLEITPIYLPIYIDAAESTTRWKTFRNRYEQNKREAWGIVDIPYVVKEFFLHPEIPLWGKLVKISYVFESHFVWSSYWFLITLGATIPTILNPVFARTALGFNLSKMSSLILTIGLVGIVAIAVIDILLNPHYKNKVKILIHPLTYLQWILLPITGLIFGSLPGLESQTRLMLGKYLEYRVTEKVGK